MRSVSVCSLVLVLSACAEVRVQDDDGGGGEPTNTIGGAPQGGAPEGGAAEAPIVCTPGELQLYGDVELLPLAPNGASQSAPKLMTLPSGNVLLAVNARDQESQNEAAIVELSPWTNWPGSIAAPVSIDADLLGYSNVEIGLGPGGAFLGYGTGSGTWLVTGLPDAPTEEVFVADAFDLIALVSGGGEYFIRGSYPGQGTPHQIALWPSGASEIFPDDCGDDLFGVTPTPGAFLTATQVRSPESCMPGGKEILDWVEVASYASAPDGGLVKSLLGTYGEGIIYSLFLLPRSDGAWLIYSQGPNVIDPQVTTFAQRLGFDGLPSAAPIELPALAPGYWYNTADPLGDGFAMTVIAIDSTTFHVFDGDGSSRSSGVSPTPYPLYPVSVVPSPDRQSLLAIAGDYDGSSERVQLMRWDCTGL